ncbi:deoxyribose-phosphate aldolase [Mycoplasma sp. 1654_15]|uniref:deoxyribose-phosphate aldolase n=1 Tax=Mycoplasma sp. 1654_15 TaxID=2725994 RepID=UPI003FA6007E
MMIDYKKMIDHTLLKPEATSKDIIKLISQAKEYGFRGVCINSSWVKLAKEKLANSDLDIISVVGFPLGACNTQTKVFEAKLAVEHGATEIDVVINVGKFKEKVYDYVLNEIQQVKKAIGNKVLKVIIETALLTKEEIKKAAELVMIAKADFVKTSTGFSYRGATADDIELIKEVVGDKVQIKAAGGIKSISDLENYYKLGATRFGTSSSLTIFSLTSEKEKIIY